MFSLAQSAQGHCCILQLLKLGVKDGRKHPVEVKLMPKGSVKLSVTYVTRVQSLSRNLSSSDSGLFGVPIGVLCQREATQVPHIVTCCCEEIERRGLDEIGIYRVSGVASDVKSLKQAFEQGNFVVCLFCLSLCLSLICLSPYLCL